MKKRFVAMTIIVVMLMSCFSANAAESTVDGASALDTMIARGEVFTAAAVKAELLSAQNRTNAMTATRQTSSLLSEVLQPVSMGIEIPKVDPSKVLDIYDRKISDMASREVYYENLAEHGFTDAEMATMTRSEYDALESTWLMDADFIAVAQKLYPELKNIDMTDWTIGKYDAYVKTKNAEQLKARFTAEQLAELEERNILVEDTFYLFKEFHNVDVILQQTDETIKEVLEGYYAFNLEHTLGSGTVAQLEEAKAGGAVELASTPTYTLPSNVVGYYSWVDFPLYGGDYFHYDAQTDDYWRNIQAYRALLTQCTIYGQIYTGYNTLYCSNMYGTYSTSQNGAHEGIDFASGQSRTVYSPVEGTKLSGGYAHQLAVYDPNHTDGAKTYSFLHMSGVTGNSYIDVGDVMGMQGQEGNAIGYHVHFEVHSGQKTTLSSGNDQILGSISPYRLTEYIGEPSIP